MDDGILSIDEMKTAAEDIKKLRPVQEAIMVALTLRSWEEIPDVLRSEVTAGNLARFMVSQAIIIWAGRRLHIILETQFTS